MLSVEAIRNALTAHQPTPSRFDGHRGCAAVAMILVGAEDRLKLCMIRRAEKSGDPWSGHMALPGGRFSPEDADLRVTAERETHEEVGLRLDPAHRLGSLAPTRHPAERTGPALGPVSCGLLPGSGDPGINAQSRSRRGILDAAGASLGGRERHPPEIVRGRQDAVLSGDPFSEPDDLGCHLACPDPVLRCAGPPLAAFGGNSGTRGISLSVPYR